jgi:hypothetical protein
VTCGFETLAVGCRLPLRSFFSELALLPYKKLFELLFVRCSKLAPFTGEIDDSCSELLLASALLWDFGLLL